MFETADLDHSLLSLQLGVGRIIPDALAAHQRLALHLHLRPGRAAVAGVGAVERLAGALKELAQTTQTDSSARSSSQLSATA